MVKKQHYYYNEKQCLEILRKEVFNVNGPDLEKLARIFDRTTFVGLKRISKAVAIISRGLTY